MDENELLEKLKTFKSMLINARLHRAGLMARIEGLNAELLVNGLDLSRVDTLMKEVSEMTESMLMIKQEQEQLCKWSVDNLPPEFHLTFDE